MADYARKLREQVQEDEPFLLLGVSFGAMVISELAELTQPAHTFVVSSAKTRFEVPGFYQYIRFLPKVIPYPVWQQAFYKSRVRKTDLDEEELRPIREMIYDSEPDLFRWATSAVLRWEREKRVANLSHIHGTKDPIFPPKYVQPDRWLPEGNHFLINTHSDTIVQWVQEKALKLDLLSETVGS